MKITFLGTGAADFLPSLADTDRFTVSRDIRRCTVTLLGEDIGMWAGTVFHAQTHLAEKPQNGRAYSFLLEGHCTFPDPCCIIKTKALISCLKTAGFEHIRKTAADFEWSLK